MGGTTVDREPNANGSLKWQIFNRPTRKKPKWLVFKLCQTALRTFTWDTDSEATVSPLPPPIAIDITGAADRFLEGVLKIKVYQSSSRVDYLKRINGQIPIDFEVAEVPVRRSEFFRDTSSLSLAVFIGYDLSKLSANFYYFDFISEEYLNPSRNPYIPGRLTTGILAFTATEFPGAPQNEQLEIGSVDGKQIARSSNPAGFGISHNPPSIYIDQTIVGEDFLAVYSTENYLFRYDGSDPLASNFVKVRLGVRLATQTWSWPVVPPATAFGWSVSAYAGQPIEYFGPESTSYYYNESTNEWLLA